MSTGLSGNGSVAAHRVQFYESDDVLIERLRRYVLDGLRDGAVIIVATATHRRMLEQALAGEDLDVAHLQATGRLAMLDAAGTLHRFYQDDVLDPTAFDEIIGGLIDDAASAGGGVHAYGEMVAVLWDAGEVNAALELEDLWNRLGESRQFVLLCGYPTRAAQAGDHAIEKVCAAHTHVDGEAADTQTGVSRRFEPTLAAAADVRRFVDSTLADWNATEQVDDVRLVASELVTNAVRHVGSDVTVTLSRPAGRVRVAVADTSTSCPSVVAADPRAASGRGLKLVQAVSAEWGCEARPDGKIVWADV
jgi:anti-sigma regulatory factor (Ser/Thr protein kinase)